ncbi:MAG: M48 family metalloprotease [Bacteroidetes bacterium]|nr:M48 family metalloprotease [Bacteroidota bacterium]
MKKENIILSTIILSLFFIVFGCANLNKSKLVDAGGKAAQAALLTDAEINQLSVEYIAYSDKENQLCKDTDPNQKKYTDRLNRIVGSANTLNGKKLDIKVYYSSTQNAFACANGSIRVYSGLMDIMSDDELFGIIGHEIGHIANKDTKEAFRKALITSAALDVVGSTGKTAATLAESQLGGLASAYASAQFSQKQEYAADDYGYNYLKKNSKNPKAMASALRTLQKLYDNPAERSKIAQMFSTHPEAGKRAARLEKK